MESKSDIIYGVPIFGKRHYHWLWLPTLYIMRGFPYVLLLFTSVVFYSQFGVDSSLVTLSTSWFVLSFILRPITSRLVLSFESKRYWILLCEFIIGLSLIGVALSASLKDWFNLSYLFFCIIGCSASFHDVAIERFYKRSANRKRRSAFVGMRFFFYMLAVVVAYAIPVIMVGNYEVLSRLIKTPWIKVFYGLGGFSLLMVIYHAIVLPPAYVQSSLPFFTGLTGKWLKDMNQQFAQRPDFIKKSVFLLCFLAPSLMLFRTLTLFLLDVPSGGGLSFSPQEVGFIQGTAGLFALVLGLVSGYNIMGKLGFIRLKWALLLGLILPKLLFVYLSYSYNNTLWLVTLFVMLDHFGFGFALNLYALLLLYVTNGKHPTFSYTMGASLLGISVLISSLLIGFVQEYFNYYDVFLFIFLSGAFSLFSMRLAGLNSALDEKFRRFIIKRKMRDL